MDSRQLVRAADKAYGPYGNGNGTDLPSPTHIILGEIDPNTYTETLDAFSEDMRDVNDKAKGTYAGFLTVSDRADELFVNLPYSDWTISRVALSAISPEWILEEGRTMEEIAAYAGCIISSRSVTKVFQDLGAWDDALDVD